MGCCCEWLEKCLQFLCNAILRCSHNESETGILASSNNSSRDHIAMRHHQSKGEALEAAKSKSGHIAIFAYTIPAHLPSKPTLLCCTRNDHRGLFHIHTSLHWQTSKLLPPVLRLHVVGLLNSYTTFVRSELQGSASKHLFWYSKHVVHGGCLGTCAGHVLITGECR